MTRKMSPPSLVLALECMHSYQAGALTQVKYSNAEEKAVTPAHAATTLTEIFPKKKSSLPASQQHLQLPTTSSNRFARGVGSVQNAIHQLDPWKAEGTCYHSLEMPTL